MKTLINSYLHKIIEPSLILRFGAAICFIGHGILAILGKTQFVTLLNSFGIENNLALVLLKGIGTLDIIVGLLLLVNPIKWVLRWAIFWTGLTILAWGFHGDSLMDLFRRVTYMTTPLALLFLQYRRQEVGKATFENLNMKKITNETSAEAIDQLDLSLICMKLMEEEEGEGWTEKQCFEVAQEYRRYLKLKLLYPNENIVPNRAIDTMWHYHILDTAAYQRDCNAVFGKMLHHYPYFGMHGESDEKQFFNSFDRTKLLYERTFSIPMHGPTYLPSFQRA